MNSKTESVSSVSSLPVSIAEENQFDELEAPEDGEEQQARDQILDLRDDSANSVDSGEIQEEDKEEDKEEGENDMIGGMSASRRRSVNLLLFLSHILSKVSDRMWMFAVPVLFVTLFKDTLIPAALFVLVSKLATMLLSPTVGSWIDRNGRLYVVLLSLFLQNAFVVICTVTIFAFYNADLLDYQGYWRTAYETMVFSFILLTGSISEIFSLASTVSLTKDWMCVITRNEGRYLGFLNKNMRRIDLLCALLAPIVFGVIYDLLDVQYSLIIVAAWNVVSFIPELGFLVIVYWLVPSLRHKEGADGNVKSTFFLFNIIRGFSTFFRSDVMLMSVSFSMLYLTLADFGVLMTAFMLNRWDGNYASVLGLARGLGAVSGIAGTWILPFLAHRGFIGLARASLISIWTEAFLLSFAPFSFVFPLGYRFLLPMQVKEYIPAWIFDRIQDVMLITSVILSRIGLYAFDIGEVQLMQTLIPAEKRGVVNSVQQGFCNLMTVAAFTLGVIVSNPDWFGILILISWLGVFSSACLYTTWTFVIARRPRVRELLDEASKRRKKKKKSNRSEEEKKDVELEEVESSDSSDDSHEEDNLE